MEHQEVLLALVLIRQDHVLQVLLMVLALALAHEVVLTAQVVVLLQEVHHLVQVQEAQAVVLALAEVDINGDSPYLHSDVYHHRNHHLSRCR